MDKLQWIFELVDRVSQPARQAAAATGGFEKELHKVEKQLENIKKNPLEFKQLQAAKKELRELTGGSKSFAARFEEMGSAIKKVGFVQNLMLGAEALHIGFEMGEKVVDVVYDIGKELVNAAGHAERMKISFQTLAGGEGGDAALEYIEKIKKYSELSGAQLQDMSAQLMTAGVSAKNLGQALPAALDIAGFNGGGVANVQAAIAAMSKIQESGKVGDRVLQSLGLGKNADAELLKSLAAARHESVESVKKAMEAGRIDPDQILRQVYEKVIKIQHGALGTTAEKMTNTVTGKLGKLKQLPEEIFEKWAGSPGFAKFSDSLGKVLKKLEPDGPNGQKIFAAIDTISGKVVDLIASFADGDGIDKFIKAITDVDGLLSTGKSVLDTIVTVSEVLATVWAGSTIVGALGSIATAAPAAATAMAAIGGPALLAIAAAAAAVYGLVKAYQALEEAGNRFNPQTIDKMAGVSKSETQRRADVLTQQTARQRLAKGLDLTDVERSTLERNGVSEDSFRKKYGGAQDTTALRGDAVASSVDSSIPAPSMRAQPGSGARVEQTAHVHPGAIIINVPHGADTDEIKDAVSSSLPGAVQQSMAGMAIASGVM